MEMCRMCLVAREGMLPMDEKFLIKYNIFTNLNITTEDKSLYACSTCFHAAIYCFEFREKCIKSDQAFKDLIIDIPKLENDNLNTGEINETLTEVKQETLEIVGDVDDAEFIDDCYNYGEDYVEPVVKRSSKREVKKEPVVDKLPKLKCGICPTVLESDAELSDHLDHHKPDYACAICKESLISAPNMLGHRIKHLPKTERRCHICSRKFISSENLEFHYMRVHEMAEKDAMILCQKCLKPFPTVKKLQKHLAHHAEMKYTCDHCSKKFRSHRLVEIHIVDKHIPKRTFDCDVCDYNCFSTSTLSDHKLRKHSVDKAVCKTCGRIFPTQEKLSKHDCKHRLPVICPVCGITYQAKGKRNINHHMKKHATNMYKCTQCPSTFKSKECFRSHMDRHDGKPRYRCEFCDRTFYNQPCFIKHRRTHTGEKPYVCKICSRGFTGNHNLKVHMKVHGIHNLIKKKDS